MERKIPGVKIIISTFMPYFLSTVIVIGIMRDMLSENDGIVNMAIQAPGLDKIDFFSTPGWFRTLYIGSWIWLSIGFNSIIYLAAIAGINTEVYESAVIEGASQSFSAAVGLFMSVVSVILLVITNLGQEEGLCHSLTGLKQLPML